MYILVLQKQRDALGARGCLLAPLMKVFKKNGGGGGDQVQMSLGANPIGHDVWDLAVF